MYNTMKKIWACKIEKKNINTRIQQEWIKLMKSDSKDFHIVSSFQKKKKKRGFLFKHTKILQTQTLNGSVYLKKSQ